MLATVFLVVPAVMGLFLWRSYSVARRRGYEAPQGARRWGDEGDVGDEHGEDGEDGEHAGDPDREPTGDPQR